MATTRTASAAERPCELLSYHAPTPSRTQGHHRHPVYLQLRVYGRVQDHERAWYCGTCHDNIHEAIGWLLGESRKPDPPVGRAAMAEARRTVAWYRQAELL